MALTKSIDLKLKIAEKGDALRVRLIVGLT